MSTIWLPYTQMKIASTWPEASHAKGSRIYLKHGQALIDAVSSWWVITIGHCAPPLVKALQTQAQKMDQVLFANFSHPPAKKLSQELKKVLPKELAYLFFSDNGSTAVEVALKMAIQSWKQKDKSSKNSKNNQRNKFLSFTHSYHGDTLGAMSVSGQSLFTRPYKKMLFSVIRAKQGRLSSDPEAMYVEDFKAQLKKHHSQLAGVIIEPFVQGAGGMVMWPKKALKEICTLSRQKGLYLIFDEVMTGFGRTGKLFAFQKLGITPDLLCLSKGLTGGFMPLALTIARQDIYKSFLSDNKKDLFFHGHSFTGNPVSCAVALAHLKEIQKPRWKNQWEKINAFYQKKLSTVKGHPNLIDARALGTIMALEFRVKNQGYGSTFAESLSQKAFKQGVFLRPLGHVAYIMQ